MKIGPIIIKHYTWLIAANYSGTVYCNFDLMQEFDSFFGSILIYGSELWGYTKSKEIERINFTCIQRLLNVKQRSSIAGVYGEFGRFPPYTKPYTFV